MDPVSSCFSHPFISPSNPLTDENASLRSKILSTPPYTASGLWEEGPEFISIHTHVHEILPHVYLGNYRAYLSVDPQFIQKYPMVDRPEEIFDGPPKQEVLDKIDQKGCSELNIQIILSITDFHPGEGVPLDDWSRFKPQLSGIQHARVPVDDLDCSWEQIEPHLETLFSHIDQARDQKKNLLIHCVQGVSRSPAVLIAYLISRCAVPFEKGLDYVQSIRHQVSIKPSWVGDDHRGIKRFEKKNIPIL
ncbi:dual specificity protein phosphatase family protein [Candidatus Neptunichlamydia sp. REUL1]|uniref:dual specificity protein phosphatase family protein n=1 Tax=Candidatus Neptunichlamydia sp. REUL1 TaxID=3064277 RepID=UPI002931AF99|nr:dual specificity protein phosphatase [Candidatus Neptunochlamydia sp. REUL1]